MKSIPVVDSVTFTVCFIMLLCACSQQKSEWEGTIEVVDGVTFVKNGSEPIFGSFFFNLEEELSIGGDPNKDEYYFPKRASLTIDDVGNLYVLDSGNFRIQKYDSSGKYLLTIGRRGQGPGEFQYPSSLTVDSAGRLWVFDPSPRAFKVFTDEGEYEKQVDVKTFISQVMVTAEELIFGRIDNFRAEEGPNTAVIKVDPETAEIETIAKFYWEKSSRRPGFGLHYYNNQLSLIRLNHISFCYGFSSEYKLYVIDETGNLLSVIEKPEAPTSISRDEKVMTGKEGVFLWTGRDMPEKWEDLDFPPHQPYFGRIFSDDQGRLYVFRFLSILDKDASSEVDVFGEDGRYLYRMTFPISPAVIKAGNFYEIRSDGETGEISIVRHRITNWKEFRSRT